MMGYGDGEVDVEIQECPSGEPLAQDQGRHVEGHTQPSVTYGRVGDPVQLHGSCAFYLEGHIESAVRWSSRSSVSAEPAAAVAAVGCPSPLCTSRRGVAV